MRTLALLAFLSLGSVLVAGCGAPTKCAPGNCTGCCDATGQCQGGNGNTACGAGGLSCGTCNLGLTCSLGVCAGTGGGNSTGGGGGTTGGGTGGGTTGGGTGGGTTGGGTGGGSGSAYATWCANYIASVCDMGVRCGLYDSTSVCRASAGFSTLCGTTPAMRDGRTVLDTSAASSCLNLINTAPCGAVDLSACNGASHGAVALNGACYGQNECVTNLYCDTSSTCPGLCHPSTPIGQTTTSGVPCAAGSATYGSVCLAPVAIGQSCAPTGTQVSDRTCASTGFCSAAKVCTAKQTSGQACTGYGQCAGILQCNGGFCGTLNGPSSPCDSSRPCKADLFCGPANVCVPLGAVNSLCTSPYGQCQSSLICAIPAGTSSGTCQPTHTLGQSCTYFGYECGFTGNLYCTATSSTSGVCALQKGVGATCQSYSECVTGTCTNSLCAGCVAP